MKINLSVSKLFIHWMYEREKHLHSECEGVLIRSGGTIFTSCLWNKLFSWTTFMSVYYTQYTDKNIQIYEILWNWGAKNAPWWMILNDGTITGVISGDNVYELPKNLKTSFYLLSIRFYPFILFSSRNTVPLTSFALGDECYSSIVPLAYSLALRDECYPSILSLLLLLSRNNETPSKTNFYIWLTCHSENSIIHNS